MYIYVDKVLITMLQLWWVLDEDFTLLIQTSMSLLKSATIPIIWVRLKHCSAVEAWPDLKCVSLKLCTLFKYLLLKSAILTSHQRYWFCKNHVSEEFGSWCHWRWWWFVARLSPNQTSNSSSSGCRQDMSDIAPTSLRWRLRSVCRYQHAWGAVRQ